MTACSASTCFRSFLVRRASPSCSTRLSVPTSSEGSCKVSMVALPNASCLSQDPMSPALTRERGPSPSFGAACVAKRARRSAQRTRRRSLTSASTLVETMVADFTSQNESTIIASRKFSNTKKTISSYDQNPSCPTELCRRQ